MGSYDICEHDQETEYCMVVCKFCAHYVCSEHFTNGTCMVCSCQDCNYHEPDPEYV